MNGMNDPIERSLASQPLRRPPDALDGRIEAALSPRRGAGARAPWRSRWALPIGAAAAITLALILLIAGPQDQPAPEGVVQAPEQGAAGDDRGIAAPVESAPPDELAGAVGESPRSGGAMWIERVWSYTEPGELFLLDEYTPMRPIRQHTVEQVSWYDEAANVRIEVTRPRDEVYYVRVPVY